MMKQHALVAGAIKTQVGTFSDRRLNAGDDVWEARELELRCAVAATANAIYVALKTCDAALEASEFAAACGLYVSNGRDNYSDCFPGELTWEVPADMTPEQREAWLARSSPPFCVTCEARLTAVECAHPRNSGDFDETCDACVASQPEASS